MFLLLLGLGVTSTPSYSQLACGTVQGNWGWEYDYSKWDLSQDGSGNVSGTVLDMGCQVPVTGTISSGAFTITATGFNKCPGGGVTWLTFQGWVGQPGCNFAYGN